MVIKGKPGIVELVCGLHHVSAGGNNGKFLSGGASAWLHQENPRVVELEVGLHHGCLGGNHECKCLFYECHNW